MGGPPYLEMPKTGDCDRLPSERRSFMASNLSFTDRVAKSAELLSVETNPLTKDLKKAGIDNDSTGIALLDADTTTIEDLVSILESGCCNGIPKLKLKAVASILKGDNLTKTTTSHENKMPVVDVAAQTKTIAEVLKANRPIEQWNDRDLLERFAKDKEYEVEQELHKRAKQQNFVVLVPAGNKGYEPGKEEIDIEKSLELLKSARKKTNPSMLSTDGKVLPIYRITELNPQERIIELCPICGESLYKGYCEKCQANFSSVSDDARAYVNLITDEDTFNANSFSDRKAIVVCAQKGLDELKGTWPSLVQKFDELKLTGNLPKLRIIANRPSDVADPYFQNGNRVFGNTNY